MIGLQKSAIQSAPSGPSFTCTGRKAGSSLVRKSGWRIAAGDEPYVMGCLAMLGKLVREHRLTSYRVYSNGPAEQDIAYLHFHLVGGD